MTFISISNNKKSITSMNSIDTLTYFHEAMGIGVIVDGRSVALAPAQNNQVEFSIALVD
jgi:hypothetical protein